MSVKVSALAILFGLVLVSCGPKSSQESEPEDCYATVEFKNLWRHTVAIYSVPERRTLVMNLSPGSSAGPVCFQQNEIDAENGLRLVVRMKEVWTWGQGGYRVEPFLRIVHGGDWLFTIEPRMQFAYTWAER
ncbi:MAG: hypothetical protein PVG79_08470 [Gemmatimonadales bacterium]|jgi:hypothetical protein